jgi:hypothetical protein
MKTVAATTSHGETRVLIHEGRERTAGVTLLATVVLARIDSELGLQDIGKSAERS